ncbi:1935_t:CDS:1, partial [Paraglomus brasilianum]
MDFTHTLDDSAILQYIPPISKESKKKPAKPFTIQEVIIAIKSKDNGSSPGPN